MGSCRAECLQGAHYGRKEPRGQVPAARAAAARLRPAEPSEPLQPLPPPWPRCLSPPPRPRQPLTLSGTAVGSPGGRQTNTPPPRRAAVRPAEALMRQQKGIASGTPVSRLSPMRQAAGQRGVASRLTLAHTCVHTDTGARRQLARAGAAQSPAARAGQTGGTRASTERAPAPLRGPGPVPEPAEGQRSPSPRTSPP